MSYPQKLDLIRGSAAARSTSARTRIAPRASSTTGSWGRRPGARWLPVERVARPQPARRRPAAAALHLSHRARRLDAGQPPARRDRAGPVAARAAAVADARRGARRAARAGVAARHRSSSTRLLDTLLRLWRRGYAATRAVVVKATSSAARLAPVLLERSAASRAIYLNLRAEPALATLLAGANSLIDLRGHGAERHEAAYRRASAPGSRRSTRSRRASSPR